MTAQLSLYERVAELLGEADPRLVKPLAELARSDGAALLELLGDAPRASDAGPRQPGMPAAVDSRSAIPRSEISEAQRIKADHDALRWDKNGYRISKKLPSSFTRGRPERPRGVTHWSA